MVKKTLIPDRCARNLRVWLLAIVASCALLVPAAIADAETRTLTGSVEGNPGSKLIVKVQRVGGAPFRILSFEFKRLTPRCFGDTPEGRVSGKVGRMKVERLSNPFDPVRLTNVFSSRDGQATLDREIGVFILGIVDRKAKKTSGNLGISFGDGCSADSGTGFSRFTATR